MKPAVGALLMVLADCAAAPSASVAPVSAVREAMSPREALFRHVIALVAPPESEYATICISDQGFRPRSDPSPELVGRLADIRPPVKPWSACKWVDPRPVDAISGRPAIQIAHDIRCADADHCGGTGGYAFGNEGGASFNYTMVRRQGRWVIQSMMTAVS